jgi:hypothetical protein
MRISLLRTGVKKPKSRGPLCPILRIPRVDTTNPKPPGSASTPERCSAFVATGSYTKDGKPIIAHNAWTCYIDGLRSSIDDFARIMNEGNNGGYANDSV